MRQELIKTLLPSKIKKLDHIFSWIQSNCSQQQKEKVVETLNQYDYLLTYTDCGMLRITHELAGRQDSIIHHVPDNGEQAQEIDVEKEILNRKKIVNGLISEIHELKNLEEVQNQ